MSHSDNNQGVNPDSEDEYGLPLPTPYIPHPSSGPTKRRRAEEDEIWERENNIERARNILKYHLQYSLHYPLQYPQSGPTEADIQAQLLQQQSSEEEKDEPPRKIQRTATNTFAGTSTARHGLILTATFTSRKRSGVAVPTSRVNSVKGVPGYLRDVQRAGWAGSVFESYEALVAWLQSDEQDPRKVNEERNVPGAYAESEGGRSSDDGNGNGNAGNGGDPPKPPSPSSSSSSSSEDDRPKSLILPWYQVPPRMPKKERRRLYGTLAQRRAWRERFNHPPVVGSLAEEYEALQREKLRKKLEKEKRQQEEQRRQARLRNLPQNGYTFRRDTSPSPPSSPERSPPPSRPAAGYTDANRQEEVRRQREEQRRRQEEEQRRQATTGRGPQPRSTLQSQLENSVNNGWGFRQSPSPSPPGNRQGSPPPSPPAPGFIRCPRCTVENRDTTTSYGTCGMLWHAAPAPRSQAHGVVPYNRQPDALFGVTYSDDEDDDDMYVMTGGAGPAGTVDAGGDPVPIPAAELTRLENARDAALYDATLREGRERDRQQTALLNGQDVPESQPYFYDAELDAAHIAEMQEAERVETIHREANLQSRRAAFVPRMLDRHSDPERTQHDEDEWLLQLKDWQKKYPLGSKTPFPGMIPGFDLLDQVRYTRLVRDIKQMQLNVQAGLRATQQVLRRTRTGAQRLAWLTLLAELEANAAKEDEKFPENVPGFANLNAVETTQLEADIAAMRKLTNDNGGDDQNNNAPSGPAPRSDAKSQKKLQALIEKQVKQQYLENVDATRREVEAAGHVFPDGAPGWEELDEDEQNRFRWAIYTIERSGGIERMRQQWTLTFDRALAQRIEDPSAASMLRQIEETRYNTRYNGLRWPEDGMTGWPDAFNTEFRQYILDATRYLEQRDVFGNSADRSDAEEPGDETETEMETQPSTPQMQSPNWVANGNEGRLEWLQWLLAQWEQAEDEGREFPESLPGWNDMSHNRRRHTRGDLGFLKDQRIAKGKNKAA